MSESLPTPPGMVALNGFTVANRQKSSRVLVVVELLFMFSVTIMEVHFPVLCGFVFVAKAADMCLSCLETCL
jgi:hypothetical protein